MFNNFVAVILTHYRPNIQATYRQLRASGYTGPIRLLIDDQDRTGDEYRRLYGDQVVTFSKDEAAGTFDVGDNFPGQKGVIYARNAVFKVVKDLGFQHFIMLDDDYSLFTYRFNSEGCYGHWKIRSLDLIFDELCDFLAATPFASVAISQGGDHIGGGAGKTSIGSSRKVMNTFVCDVDRPFPFIGRINEDVNTYTALQRAGLPFLTFMALQVNQAKTQENSGGMTDLYLDNGTYVKSFYSVMYAPSCVKIHTICSPADGHKGYKRLHHRVAWNNTAPKIIRQKHKKA